MEHNTVVLNVAYFIARRFFGGILDKDNLSTTYVKIAIVAVSISLTVMIASLGTGFGLQREIKRKIASFGAHLKIVNYSSDYTQQGLVKPVELQPKNTYQDLHSTIKHAQPYITLSGLIRTEETFQGVIMKGVNQDYDFSFFTDKMVKGKMPSFGDSRSNKIWFSETMAKQMQLQIGDKFQVAFTLKNRKYPAIRKFELVGIFHTGWAKFDENMVFCDMRWLQQLLRWNANQVSGIELFIEEVNRIDEIRQKIYYKVGKDQDVIAITEEYSEIFNWVSLFDTNVYIILSLMILVAVINIITVLLIMIFERIKLIGTLKSFGAKNQLIRRIFIYKGVYIIYKGLFYGNLIGIGILLILKYGKIIQLNPKVYYVNSLPADIDLFHILLANALILIICTLSMTIPTYMVTRISPAQAVRNK